MSDPSINRKDTRESLDSRAYIDRHVRPQYNEARLDVWRRHLASKEALLDAGIDRQLEGPQAMHDIGHTVRRAGRPALGINGTPVACFHDVLPGATTVIPRPWAASRSRPSYVTRAVKGAVDAAV